jgi:hypothetical protein
MRDISDRLEYTSHHDLFCDFCLWEYTPNFPYENKFRSVNLLYHSFTFAGVSEGMFELVQTIRQGLGNSRSVWGVKHIGDDIRWEYYFYDYRRRDRERSITRLLDIISPFARCSIKANESFHYFMFSIDIDNDLISGGRELEEIHMYIGNPGSTVSSGICYSLTSKGTRLENFYFFFDAKKQKKEILDKAFCSAYVDTISVNVDQLFWPKMRNCRIMVVANKQGNDAIYFSGIDIDQLIYFLKRLKYPPALTSFVEENRAKLDHMYYDAGFDYRMEGGELIILKSGYYGIF